MAKKETERWGDSWNENKPTRCGNVVNDRQKFPCKKRIWTIFLSLLPPPFGCPLSLGKTQTYHLTGRSFHFLLAFCLCYVRICVSYVHLCHRIPQRHFSLCYICAFLLYSLLFFVYANMCVWLEVNFICVVFFLCSPYELMYEPRRPGKTIAKLFIFGRAAFDATAFPLSGYMALHCSLALIYYISYWNRIFGRRKWSQMGDQRYG